MSKYDQYIKDFIITTKQVSIERIGTFTVPALAGDDKLIQSQLIDFQFDKKAQTSQALIDFIVKETGKNKTLISSDLTSVFEDARQYINIGKPYNFAGLGIISLNRSGGYDFAPQQGNVSLSAAEGGAAAPPKAAAETPARMQAGRNVVMFFAFLIILLVIGGLGWGIYKYIKQPKSDTVFTAPAENAVDTTAKQKTVAADTLALTKSTTDSADYKFIFETTLNKYRAHNRYDSLKSWGEHVFLDSTLNDTATVYHLFLRAKLTAKDTAHVKDSVQKYFQRPIRIAQ